MTDSISDKVATKHMNGKNVRDRISDEVNVKFFLQCVYV